MIDIGTMKASAAGYGTSISGDDGEQELTILLAGGQSGSFRILAVAMACDGGRRGDGLQRDIAYEDGPKSPKALAVLLTEIVMDWAFYGAKKPKEVPSQVDNTVALILAQHHYSVVKHD